MMAARLVPLVALLCACSNHPRWAAYYAADAETSRLRGYDLLVLDSEHHPPLPPLREGGVELLGYLSVGEVEAARDHYQRVRDLGLLGAENPNWPGSYHVDLRDPRWHVLVVEELIPELLERGHQGVFLDTLDNPLELERIDPDRYAGMRQAAASLVLEIRERFPEIPIMVNRAYAILPRIDHAIDYVLGESIMTDYDFSTGRYRFVERAEYERQVELLQDAKLRRPQLTVMTLDYWRPDDTDTIEAIYRKQRENGFVPYVATVELDRLIPEP